MACMEAYMRVLAINPGSTSTKIAVYDDETVIMKASVEHGAALTGFSRVADQYDLRKAAVLDALGQALIPLKTLDAVVGRGGFLPPVVSGAYVVNQAMVRRLAEAPSVEHAANLAAPIALSLAQAIGLSAYIYDSVAVDELEPIARLSGCAEVERLSLSHALNMRATAIRCAKDLGKPYRACDFVVAHLGGGITLSAHQRGRMVDLVSDDEGPFSPERAGALPAKDLIRLCYSRDEESVRRMLRGDGGLRSYLGTNDALAVENRVVAGDAKARLVYQAMAYQCAKAIGSLATVLSGRLDAIILTGGLARSSMLVDWISERVSFIAPVHVYPGENELEALAFGALRVLRGEERANEYIDPDFA